MKKYQIKINVSGEVKTYYRAAADLGAALHMARLQAMKDYQKGFAEISRCDYEAVPTSGQ
jgi:hypothetical protein